MNKKGQQSDPKYNFVIARSDDGNVQVTATVPYQTVQDTREKALRALIEDLEVPGFRKGKAPTDVAEAHIDKKRLYERTLQDLLSDIYQEALKKYSLRPIINPRFELISVEEGKEWSIRIVTAELPEINVGDYKKAVTASGRAGSIWVPGKSAPDGKEVKEKTREEKEQMVIKALLESSEVKVPKLLVDEEVNHRLAQLLDQVQKLGLTIDQYLTSTNKTIESVKSEYASQAAETIKLLLVLNKIAEEEKINVDEKEIKEVIKTSNNTVGDGKEEREVSQEQKNYIKSILLRRKALDSLTRLV